MRDGVRKGAKWKNRQASFERFMSKGMGMDEAEITITYYDLWLRAQHEGDKEYDGDTWEEYFNEIVLHGEDDRWKAEGTRELKAYMDSMPCWTLKGFAPCEVP